MTTNPPNVAVVPGGKPAVLCSADCQKCAKRGLPWVAVIDTVVDSGHQKYLAQAGHTYAAEFDAGFAAFKSETTVPAARLPGAGWVWVLYEDIGRWDGWQNFADGSNRLLLQKVSPQDYLKQSPGLQPSTDDMVCSRGAANLGAGFFTISGAMSHSSVWLAYSAHMWSPAVLSAYTADSHGQRARRMTQVLASSWINGGAQPRSSVVLSEAALAAHVAEYSNSPPGGASTSPLRRAFENSSRPFNTGRLGLAKAMEGQARAMEEAAGQVCKNRALIIRLSDDIGVAAEHNHLRLLAADLKKAWAIGGPDWKAADADPVRAWKLASSLHVNTIEQWAESAAHAEVRKTVTRAYNKNIPPVTEEDFQGSMASGEYPSGTTWEPLFLTRHAGGVFPPRVEPVLGADGQPVAQTVASTQRPGQQTRLGRVQVPSQWVKASADPRAKATIESRLARYREKLDLPVLNDYCKAFNAASDRWDTEYIGLFDKDCVRWRQAQPLQRSLKHDFDEALHFIQPDLSRGTLAQQARDFAALVEALDKVYGGGALSAASALDMRQLLDLPAADP